MAHSGTDVSAVLEAPEVREFAEHILSRRRGEAIDAILGGLTRALTSSGTAGALAAEASKQLRALSEAATDRFLAEGERIEQARRSERDRAAFLASIEAELQPWFLGTLKGLSQLRDDVQRVESGVQEVDSKVKQSLSLQQEQADKLDRLLKELPQRVQHTKHLEINDELAAYLLRRAWLELAAPDLIVLGMTRSRTREETLHMRLKPALERAIGKYLDDVEGNAAPTIIDGPWGSDSWKRGQRESRRWADREEKVQDLTARVLACVPDEPWRS
jgi:hypothetical protein